MMRLPLREVVRRKVRSHDTVHCSRRENECNWRARTAITRARGRTCSINNQQPRTKERLETRRLHEPDVGQPRNNVDDERGQAGAFEAENYAHVVCSEGYADYWSE